MIRSFIIDDEPAARNSLEILLTRHFSDEVTVAGKAATLWEGVGQLQRHPVDLLFLDIEMPYENGFKIFDYFPVLPFEVIFTTAYREYAIQAVKVAALDYILKPVTPESLTNALALYRKRKIAPPAPVSAERQVNILQSTASYPERVALPSFDGFFFERVCDIVYCAADQVYTQVHLTNGRSLVVSKPLCTVEQLLPEQLFFRIHKSFLVNLSFVNIFSREGGFHVILENGTRLNVASRRKSMLLQILTQKRSKRNQQP